MNDEQLKLMSWIRDKNFLTRMTIILTTDDTDSTDSQLFAIILTIENHGIHGYSSLTWMPINWPINCSLIQLPEVHSMRTKTKNTPLRGKNKGKSVAMKWVPAEIAEIAEIISSLSEKGIGSQLWLLAVGDSEGCHSENMFSRWPAIETPSPIGATSLSPPPPTFSNSLILDKKRSV